MIKTAIIIVIALFMLLSSASFALDDKGNETISDATARENKGTTERLLPGRGLEMLFTFAETKGEKYIFSDMGKTTMKPDHLEGTGASAASYSRKLNLPPVAYEVSQIGKALITNFALHELGHKVMADHVGARGAKYTFLKKNQDGQFFLSESTFDRMDEEAKLSFSIAGEIAADLTFEHALHKYRKNPSLYNKSLLFFSGTDFLWYCLYAFYLSDGHSHFDPVAITEETGISKDALFSIALTKTLANAYRVYSGKDYVIPYFAADKTSASLNLMIMF